MANASAASGFAALCLAFAALELFSFLNSQCGAGTVLLHSAAEAFPPLAAVVLLFVAVALSYRHLMSRDAAAAAPVAGAAGNGRRRSISGHVVMLALCVSAATLEFILFGGQGAAGAGRHGGAQARALGLAALSTLPAAATVTFFCGMMLIVAGSEAGGAGAVAEDGPVIQGFLLRFLAKVAAGAAAVLSGLMAMALTLTLYSDGK